VTLRGPALPTGPAVRLIQASSGWRERLLLGAARLACLRKLPAMGAIFTGLRRSCAVAVVPAATLLVPGMVDAQDDFAAARQHMVREIEQTQREVAEHTGSKALDRRVLAVMADVPRHLFVPKQQQGEAYDNRPLPIGHGQTISQPYIVALMTDLLQVEPGDRVFELGTGSGYQAAILARLGREVYSVEIVPSLGRQAAEVLAQHGYRNVEVKVADGYYGWPEHAPFDAIIVTAAASHVPPPLVRQLKVGGRMVIPVGTSFLTQHLMLVQKEKDGSVTTRQILPVRFVPLTGGH
jgi:protein-L-isoaspartate(D-aspartate) O-methyltransferase